MDYGENRANLLIGGFGATFATNSADWANFGNYFGGVAGPLLSFLALMAVAWTVRLQYALLRRDVDKQTAEQHVRWLAEIYKDVLDLLHAPLGIPQRTVNTTIWAVLNSEIAESVPDGAALKARLTELLKLLLQYCDAIAQYRDNVTRFYDIRIFEDRGARLLDRLKRFQPMIGSQYLTTFEFCDMHLRGIHERKNPEAFHRDTRS